MKDLAYRKMPKVSVLPAPSSVLEGVILELSTDNKPYYCDGITWMDLTASAGGGGTPGGSNGSLQYNIDGVFVGASRVTVNDNDLLLLESATPTVPVAGVKLFGRKMASRMLPAMIGPSGLDVCLQPSMWRQKIGMLSATGNATTMSALAMNNATALGAATSRTIATTNMLTRIRRLGYVSVATAGGFAGHYYTARQFSVGNGAGLGGFFAVWRFAVTDAAAVSGARMFVGMSTLTAAPTNVEPSTLVNHIGLAQLSTSSTELYIVYGGSTAQAAIPLGANFPPMNGIGATNGAFYDFTLFAPPSSNGVVHYRLERVGTSYIAEGTLTPATVGVQTPASSTLLMPRIWRCNNATALAVAVDISSVYVETDY